MRMMLVPVPESAGSSSGVMQMLSGGSACTGFVPNVTNGVCFIAKKSSKLMDNSTNSWRVVWKCS